MDGRVGSNVPRIGRALFWFTLVVAVLCTQFPFRYHLDHAHLAEKISEIDWKWFHYTRDGHIKVDRDFIQNVIMLVPLGVGFALWRRAPLWRVIVEGTLVGFAVSFCLEAAQLLTPGRFTQLDDLWRNTLGCALGAVVAGILSRVPEVPLRPR